ncbi:hypothetical protein EX30DRAFT_342372 [Ascodesmis nigricans]|uniref:Uncharacterized protein n=1 Tax=Ascodesmis nigricans TaxID=341454 RepID=A0A4S2MQJ7_9PEZI|nr:hypothetical protein EX30DRAFT_342372 [Ascodesmis nigricans]
MAILASPRIVYQSTDLIDPRSNFPTHSDSIPNDNKHPQLKFTCLTNNINMCYAISTRNHCRACGTYTTLPVHAVRCEPYLQNPRRPCLANDARMPVVITKWVSDSCGNPTCPGNPANQLGAAGRRPWMIPQEIRDQVQAGQYPDRRASWFAPNWGQNGVPLQQAIRVSWFPEVVQDPGIQVPVYQGPRYQVLGPQPQVYQAPSLQPQIYQAPMAQRVPQV